ncbi:ligase-associated DNA damage response exonuclease [Granulosicoccus sp. 3-233]|uniref:ligase-associated DNA damage response exonuclease n=1 Tax=Granulosicoccus sp. 3-233 TaxID=3417969 RepID=UPI003D32A7DD
MVSDKPGVRQLHHSASADDLILATDVGLACPTGGFVIDPMQRTHTAVISHAHADHARPVAELYYASDSSVPLLKKRLGSDQDIRGVPFGKPITLGQTQVSFHPAGHVLGSAQIRVEADNRIWVFTGDFKRDPDPSCEPFELVPCDTLITETTFALPVYRWQAGTEVAAEIAQWWQEMQQADRPAVLFAYSLGKAQRVLSELTAFTDCPVHLHGAVQPLTQIYRDAGINMLPSLPVDLEDRSKSYAGELIIAPPGASGSTWMRRFPGASTGFCSGWMRIRGNRRRRGYDRGFVLSDHADWPGLLRTIEETGATRILTTHGRADSLIRLLRERGLDAAELAISYRDEEVDDAEL